MSRPRRYSKAEREGMAKAMLELVGEATAHVADRPPIDPDPSWLVESLRAWFEEDNRCRDATGFSYWGDALQDFDAGMEPNTLDVLIDGHRYTLSVVEVV